MDMVLNRFGRVVLGIKDSIELVEEGGGIFSVEFILERRPDRLGCLVGGQQD